MASLDEALGQIAFNGFIQDIPSKGRKIHILLKCIWNFLKDRPSIGTQNKSL